MSYGSASIGCGSEGSFRIEEAPTPFTYLCIDQIQYHLQAAAGISVVVMKMKQYGQFLDRIPDDISVHSIYHYPGQLPGR